MDAWIEHKMDLYYGSLLLSSDHLYIITFLLYSE